MTMLHEAHFPSVHPPFSICATHAKIDSNPFHQQHSLMCENVGLLIEHDAVKYTQTNWGDLPNSVQAYGLTNQFVYIRNCTINHFYIDEGVNCVT
jgi:hypothetical protein